MTEDDFARIQQIVKGEIEPFWGAVDERFNRLEAIVEYALKMVDNLDQAYKQLR